MSSDDRKTNCYKILAGLVRQKKLDGEVSNLLEARSSTDPNVQSAVPNVADMVNKMLGQSGNNADNIRRIAMQLFMSGSEGNTFDVEALGRFVDVVTEYAQGKTVSKVLIDEEMRALDERDARKSSKKGSSSGAPGNSCGASTSQRVQPSAVHVYGPPPNVANAPNQMLAVHNQCLRDCQAALNYHPPRDQNGIQTVFHMETYNDHVRDQFQREQLRQHFPPQPQPIYPPQQLQYHPEQPPYQQPQYPPYHVQNYNNGGNIPQNIDMYAGQPMQQNQVDLPNVNFAPIPIMPYAPPQAQQLPPVRPIHEREREVNARLARLAARLPNQEPNRVVVSRIRLDRDGKRKKRSIRPRPADVLPENPGASSSSAVENEPAAEVEARPASGPSQEASQEARPLNPEDLL